MISRQFTTKFVSGILLLVCISAIMLRIPGVFTPLWSIDEAVSACVANAIVAGGIPYQDAIDHRGPVTYYAYALMFSLFGANNMVAVHFGLFALILLVGWLLYGCGAMMADTTTGLLAAGVFFLLSFGLFGAKDLLAAHTEYGVILFSTFGGYTFLRYQYFPKQHWRLGVSGLCYGLAFFSKQPAVLDFCAAFGCIGILAMFMKISLRNAVRQCGFMMAGFLCAVVGIAGFFFMRGGLRDFVFYFWTYNTEFYVTNLSALERLSINTSFFHYLFAYFPVFGLGLAAGGLYSLYGFWRTRRQPEFQPHEAQLFAVLWAIGALSAPVISGRIPAFGHYYIQALPALSLLNALALKALFKMVSNAFGKSSQRHWLRRIISLSAFAGLLGLSVYTVPRFYAHFLASLPGSADNWIEQEAVRYIRQQTQADETIFVWGFFPELYVLADRRPASRYVYTNVLTGFIPWEHMEPEYDTSAAIVPGTWDILMSELCARRPRLIIDTSPGQYRGYGKYPPQKFPLLAEFLEQNYAVVHDVAAGPNLVALRIFQLRSVE